MVTITRKVEFDAGHRIPDHGSKCRNAHGHRYVLECTVQGPVNDSVGQADTGMVIDFGTLKEIMQRLVADPWDHSFLVHRDDTIMLRALGHLGSTHRTVVLNKVPTVENLVQLAFDLIAEVIVARYPTCHLVEAKMYETPNCWAVCTSHSGRTLPF